MRCIEWCVKLSMFFSFIVVSIAHVRVNDLRERDLLVRVGVARSGVVGHRRDDRIVFMQMFSTSCAIGSAQARSVYWRPNLSDRVGCRAQPSALNCVFTS